MRQNIGVSFNDKQLFEENYQLIPPLRIVAPWAFKVCVDIICFYLLFLFCLFVHSICMMF